MTEFVYRTASDHALYARHFKQTGGVPVMDMDAAAICSGVASTELSRRVAAGTGPVIAADELERGRARTDMVRIKIGREPSLFDTLREFGDEAQADGLVPGRSSC